MTQKLRSPIQWFGGKQRLASKLLELIPDHQTYCEVFGGGGSLLFAKEPSPVEVYNDLDGDLVNFFRVLRDPQLFADFYNRAWLSPYSREEYDFCRANLNSDRCPIERARRFFILARFSFSGIVGNSFGLNVTASSRGMVEKVSGYRNVLCVLPLLSDRLSRVEIECRDFRKILDTYDTPESFFYLDPPYIPSTRKNGSYRCELTKEDHCDLVELLRNVQGKVMLSGYPSELYDSLGWKRTEWEAHCSAVGRTRNSGIRGAGSTDERHKRVECVWVNYEVA